MARRNGRPGDYLFSDDYSGNTVFASKVRSDFWQDYTAGKVLKRNLQEIATPLNDPYPVPIFNGSQFEQTTACQFEIIPLFIGNTNIPFPTGSAYVQAFFTDLDPAIPDMSVGCTLVVH